MSPTGSSERASVRLELARRLPLSPRDWRLESPTPPAGISTHRRFFAASAPPCDTGPIREGGASAWGLVPAANLTRSDPLEDALLMDRREERGRSDGCSLGVPAPASRLRCMAAPDKDACMPSTMGLRAAAKEEEDGDDSWASDPELECA